MTDDDDDLLTNDELIAARKQAKNVTKTSGKSFKHAPDIRGPKLHLFTDDELINAFTMLSAAKEDYDRLKEQQEDAYIRLATLAKQALEYGLPGEFIAKAIGRDRRKVYHMIKRLEKMEVARKRRELLSKRVEREASSG